jgi:glutathione S-transferase
MTTALFGVYPRLPMSPARLLTIPFSHYCEKARWAADHVGLAYVEEAYLPGLHVRPVRRTGGKTVPVLVLAERPLTDSSDIVRHCDAVAAPSKRLYPEDEAARAEVLAIEAVCDAELGVATRLLAYHHGLPHAWRFSKVLRPSVTAAEAFVLPFVLTLFAPRIRRLYDVTTESAARAEATARRIFADLGKRLEGQPFLSGDRFGAADLTFASLSAPLVLPEGHPKTIGSADGIPPALRALVLELRATPAGAHAMRMYREHRSSRAS